MTTPGLVPFASAVGDLSLIKQSWMHVDFQVATSTGDTVATLSYRFTGRAEGATSEGSWELSRPKGLLQRSIRVTAAGSAEPVANIDLKVWTRGGALQIGGTTYEVTGKGLLRERWALLSGEQELLAVTQTGRLGQQKATIALTDDARENPHGSLLVLLVVHAMITHQREAANAPSA